MNIEKNKAGYDSAFTLLELLVVVGLIAILAVLFISGLTGGGKAAALASTQASVLNLVTAARLQATATGRKSRLLLNIDVTAPDRFLRFVVWQRARQPGSNPVDWDTVETFALPEGCYAIPATLLQAAGLVDNAAAWQRRSHPTQSLSSDLFSGQTLLLGLAGDDSQQAWTGVAFTAQGTLAALAGGPPSSGAWLLTVGAIRAPGTYNRGESSVRLTSPRTVRGLILSAYGVATLVSDPDAL